MAQGALGEVDDQGAERRERRQRRLVNLLGIVGVLAVVPTLLSGHLIYANRDADREQAGA